MSRYRNSPGGGDLPCPAHHHLTEGVRSAKPATDLIPLTVVRSATWGNLVRSLHPLSVGKAGLVACEIQSGLAAPGARRVMAQKWWVAPGGHVLLRTCKVVFGFHRRVADTVQEAGYLHPPLGLVTHRNRGGWVGRRPERVVKS